MSTRHRNIHAFTAPGSSFPPYLSINVESDGNVSIHVRSKAAADGRMGSSASISLTPAQFGDMMRDLSHLRFRA